MVQIFTQEEGIIMSSSEQRTILLAHGGGGRLTDALIRHNIAPRLSNDALNELTDAAKLNLRTTRICFTTDSYVVKPIFFRGGDIGKLSVCGTINDLAVSGSRPVALSLGLIVEEGLPMDTFERILDSIAETARAAGVSIVTGDTKVVDSGSADQIFINTAGIGERLDGIELGFRQIQPGDQILISGTIGDHGMTIVSQRTDIGFKSPLQSDCAAMSPLTMKLLESVPGIRFMRDPTRGGLAATLNEIADAAGVGVEIVEAHIPVSLAVRAAADALGFDVLDIANEGKIVVVGAPESAQAALDICKGHPLGKHAAIIGEVRTAEDGAVVEMVTTIGGRRIVQMPYGRELPRIC
jgi:hydrogenase expression/formation protein HypE